MTAGADDAEIGLAAALLRVSFLVQGVFAQVAERHGLRPVQAKLLCLLVDGPRGMAELARLLGVEKAALTGLVDRVDRRGLVRRAAVPGDRRAFHATLTEPGRAAAAAFHRDVQAELDALAAGLGPAAAGGLRRSLVQILGARAALPTFATTRPEPAGTIPVDDGRFTATRRGGSHAGQGKRGVAG